MATYEDNVITNQYLDIDLNLYERLLSDNLYKEKLALCLELVTNLKINSLKAFILYQLQLEQLKGVSYNDIMSYKRLQNIKRLQYVASKYQEKIDKQNLIVFTQKKPKH